MSETAPSPSSRVRVKRHPERGVYDRQAVYEILDEGVICHIAFLDGGAPVIIPTAYVRVGDAIYFHGANRSRLHQKLLEAEALCVSVTLLDGLVLARSAFSHSMNYRSVVIFGQAAEVADDQEKLQTLEIFSQHVLPGRWADVRVPSGAELKGTYLLRIDIQEVSAKVRCGPPKDSVEDYALNIWAGELPLRVVADLPVPDPRNLTGLSTPCYIGDYAAKLNSRRTGKNS